MFVRGQRLLEGDGLFHFSLPICGVYWRVAFKKGNTVQGR